MKICFIGKYPPIEGGESSKLYWLARELGRRGHEVHVVTNSFCVERRFRERLRGSDLKYYQPPGVTVHNLDPFKLPHFVLRSPSYAQRLTSLATYIVKEYDLDLIIGWYLIPYGTAALLTAYFTGKPYILRHAGSDLNRLGRLPSFRFLIDELLRHANRVITYPSRKEKLIEKGVIPYNLFIDRSTSVETDFFSPQNKISARCYLPSSLFKESLPIITYIGKISQNKGLLEIVESLSLVKKRGKKFKFLVLGDGGSFKKELKRKIKELELEKEVVFSSFIPPWRIPGVINLSTLIVCPEYHFPIKVHNPILVREVFSCGGCLLLSEELYRKQPKVIKKNKNVVVIDPSRVKKTAEKIVALLDNLQKREEIGREARKAALKREDFKGYVDQFERFFQEVVRMNTVKRHPQKLILFRGPPGSGKTTISSEIKKLKPDLAVIKFDSLRRIISDDPVPFAFKNLTLRMTEKMVEFLLREGLSVLIEGTFFYEKEVEPFYRLARNFKIPFFVFDIFASYETLKKRVVQSKPKSPLRGGVFNFDRAFSNYRCSRFKEKKYRLVKIDTEKLSLSEAVERIIASVWGKENLTL